MRKRKDGFTLVELSIVLVIIGLLIGGILVGQSMMETARITKTIKMLGQFDAGVENFKTKYNYLPGDAPMFGGDGNGLIDSNPWGGSGTGYVAELGCESVNFWSNMMPQSFQGVSSPCPGSGVPGYSTGPLTNIPASPMGAPGAVFYATALCCNAGGGYDDDPTVLQNWYSIVPGVQLQTLPSFGRYGPALGYEAVTPAELLALDQKMDDGSANTGNVIAGWITGWTSLQAGHSPSNCSVNSTYSVSSSGYNCTPLIRIGTESGDLQ